MKIIVTLTQKDLVEAVNKHLREKFRGKAVTNIKVKSGSEVTAEIQEPSDIDPY